MGISSHSLSVLIALWQRERHQVLCRDCLYDQELLTVAVGDKVKQEHIALPPINMALQVLPSISQFYDKMTLPVAAVGAITLLFSYYILRSIYRITLHPLAKFPGPKLPAVTRWYEAYYEVFVDGTGGKFGEKIEEWHKKYGPIVRINPFEIHIDDPEYYDVLFNFNPHLWKRTFAIGEEADFDREGTVLSV